MVYESIVGKRKRSDNIKNNSNINNLYDIIMEIQYKSISKKIIKINKNYYLIEKNFIINHFDIKSEIVYFIKYISNYGYNYY